MKKKRTNISTIILGAILMVGVGLISYPSIANWWNQNFSTHVVYQYEEAIKNLDDADYSKYLKEAEEYNESLQSNSARFNPTDEEHSYYNTLLQVGDSPLLGSINIPKIKCNLPIYHGTDDEVLRVGVGHIEGSSLPVGGIGTHCVLSGHRGLPSAELFTRLPELQVGDYFIVKSLNKVLTYEIECINIVLPTETENLNIDENRDLCSLITCTPYGVNSHRIIVTGHRIDNLRDVEINSEASQIKPIYVAGILGLLIVLVLLIILFLRNRKQK